MPAMSNETVPLITLPNWVKSAAACGFSIEPVFRELGIDLDLLHVESAHLLRSDFERLMEVCVARSPRRHFPLVLGETFAFEYLPELETFVTTSATLRESARIFDWLPSFINPYLRVRVRENDTLSWLTLDPQQVPPARTFQWFLEATFVSVIKFGRALLRGRGDFRCARFQIARPAYADQLAEVFRMPVVFEQAHNALEIDRRLMDRPLDGAFEALHQQAEQRVVRRLSQHPSDLALSQRVERALERRPELLRRGVESVAAELGLHPRTLQRRLQAEGVRYADVQSRLRHRLAREWLLDPRIEIETISERLGFSDRRSFTRAFVQWSGQTPSEFRGR
jgi:AraC-like DNA-binding protein